MRDEFNEISFILNIWLFKSTQNLKKKKQKTKTKQNHCHNDDNHTFLITLTIHTKLHGLKLFEKKYNFSKNCEIIFNWNYVLIKWFQNGVCAIEFFVNNNKFQSGFWIKCHLTDYDKLWNKKGLSNV